MDERNAGAIAWFVFSGWASIESWRHHGFISAPSSTSTPLTPLHPPHGVDEWLEHDVLDFLSARNVSDTILHAMQSLGLNGHSLMLLDNQTFHNIGIAASELQHLLAEIETLRLTVQAAPLDFWEWRAVNLRLFDMWLMPLSLDPRTLLAWARLRGGGDGPLSGNSLHTHRFIAFWATLLLNPYLAMRAAPSLSLAFFLCILTSLLTCTVPCPIPPPTSPSCSAFTFQSSLSLISTNVFGGSLFFAVPSATAAAPSCSNALSSTSSDINSSYHP